MVYFPYAQRHPQGSGCFTYSAASVSNTLPTTPAHGRVSFPTEFLQPQKRRNGSELLQAVSLLFGDALQGGCSSCLHGHNAAAPRPTPNVPHPMPPPAADTHQTLTPHWLPSLRLSPFWTELPKEGHQHHWYWKNRSDTKNHRAATASHVWFTACTVHSLIHG